MVLFLKNKSFSGKKKKSLLSAAENSDSFPLVQQYKLAKFLLLKANYSSVYLFMRNLYDSIKNENELYIRYY